MRSHSSVKARILHVSSTNRMPALQKNEMRPTTSGKSSGSTCPDSRTASRTPMAVASGYAHLADLALGLGGVGVVAGLGGQVEGDGQARLALAQVCPVQLVGGPRARVTGVRPHHPRLVGHGLPLSGGNRKSLYPTSGRA